MQQGELTDVWGDATAKSCDVESLSVQDQGASMCGMQAIMDDTAHELPAASVCSDAEIHFIGSRSSLAHAEIGSRVR